jgi:YD repeat-containing protein
MLIASGCSPKGSKQIITYWENGNKKSKGELVGDKKLGHWFIYNQSGKIEKREKWKNGEWIWTITYNEKHEKIEWIDYKGNRKTFKPCGCGH